MATATIPADPRLRDDLRDMDPTCAFCTRVLRALRHLQAHLPEHPNVATVANVVITHGAGGQHGASCTIVCDYRRLPDRRTLTDEEAHRLLITPEAVQEILTDVAACTGLVYRRFIPLPQWSRQEFHLCCAWSNVPDCAEGRG